MLLGLILAALVPIREVTFDEALAAAGRRAEVVAAQEALSRRRPEARVFSSQPQLQVAPGYRATPAEDAGLDAQISLSQGYSLAGEEAARQATGAARRAQLEATLEARREAARFDVAGAWFDAWRSRRAYETALAERTMADELLAQAKRLAAARALTEVDVAEAEAFVAEAELDRLGAEGHLFEAGMALAAALELQPSSPVTAGGALPKPGPELPALSVDAHPEVVEAVRAADVAAARERELAAQAGPHVQAGVIFQRESPGSYIGFLTGTFTLPVWETTLHERNEALSERALQLGEAAAARRRRLATVGLARHEKLHALEVLETTRDKLLPAAERLVQLRERLLSAGEGALFELMSARRQLVGVRRRLVAAEADEALASWRWHALSRYGGEGEAR
jgi:cobalt-zinc-cadmium efflux system outer membrane protein